jgi:hypothetical protein
MVIPSVGNSNVPTGRLVQLSFTGISGRQTSPAFALLVEALRYRA